mmetsp:Transcript_21332/g.49449  ORF Transcript_21332/g.49449 Transcript_21332/m.49449 type:complete len:239 (-) Transcript_21332:1714-2430(-)
MHVRLQVLERLLCLGLLLVRLRIPFRALAFELELPDLGDALQRLVQVQRDVVEHHVYESDELVHVLALLLDRGEVDGELRDVEQQVPHVRAVLELLVKLVVRARDLNVYVELCQGGDERVDGDGVFLKKGAQVAALVLKTLISSPGNEVAHNLQKMASKMGGLDVFVTARKRHEKVAKVVQDGQGQQLEHRGHRLGDELDRVEDDLEAELGHHSEHLGGGGGQGDDGGGRVGQLQQPP